MPSAAFSKCTVGVEISGYDCAGPTIPVAGTGNCPTVPVTPFVTVVPPSTLIPTGTFVSPGGATFVPPAAGAGVGVPRVGAVGAGVGALLPERNLKNTRALKQSRLKSRAKP